MASPQTENGFIKIANELWNEILRRDFSKRQLNLILFIWRLSYGTGQKDCLIDKFNQFEIVGIYKNDIKKELVFLRECSVLNWDEKTMVFSINKNYQIWQITPSKNWDIEKFDSLIHLNLNRKKVSKTLTPKKKKVSKTLTFKSELVSKTLTKRLVKYQPRGNSNIVVVSDYSSLKTVLKTLKIKDIKDISSSSSSSEQEFSEVMGFYQSNLQRGVTDSPFNTELITQWFDEWGADLLLAAMKVSAKAEAKGVNFTEGVLKKWKEAGVKTIEDARKYETEFKSGNKSYKDNVVKIPNYGGESSGNGTSNEQHPNKSRHVKLYK
ncbi:replication protein [Oceanobacillus sp. CF4.6]|uniref:replication protein n=1 Tax=Oceanobacillus sp. CF4.6 TaxID=3373080 RepID=UPI003EE75013